MCGAKAATRAPAALIEKPRVRLQRTLQLNQRHCPFNPHRHVLPIKGFAISRYSSVNVSDSSLRSLGMRGLFISAVPSGSPWRDVCA